MSRNAKTHSRAARKANMARLKRTLDGLSATVERTRQRSHAADARAATAVDQVRQTERLRADDGDLLESARRLVGMVSKYCIAHRIPTQLALASRSYQAEKTGRFDLPLSHWNDHMPDSGRTGKISHVRDIHEAMSLLGLKAVHESFEGRVHVRVQLGDGQAGYAISDRALRDMSDEDLEECIAPEIARVLVRGIRQAAGGRSSAHAYGADPRRGGPY